MNGIRQDGFAHDPYRHDLLIMKRMLLERYLCGLVRGGFRMGLPRDIADFDNIPGETLSVESARKAGSRALRGPKV